MLLPHPLSSPSFTVKGRHFSDLAKSKRFCSYKFCGVLIKVSKIYRQSVPPGMAEFHAAPVYQEQLPVVQLELEGNPNSLALRRPFDPVAHELDATFRLTRFADLKG